MPSCSRAGVLGMQRITWSWPSQLQSDAVVTPAAMLISGWLIPVLVVVCLLLFISFAAWRIPLPKDFIPTYQEYLRDRGVNLPNTLALWISPGWGILVYSPVLLTSTSPPTAPT